MGMGWTYRPIEGEFPYYSQLEEGSFSVLRDGEEVGMVHGHGPGRVYAEAKGKRVGPLASVADAVRRVREIIEEEEAHQR